MSNESESDYDYEHQNYSNKNDSTPTTHSINKTAPILPSKQSNQQIIYRQPPPTPPVTQIITNTNPNKMQSPDQQRSAPQPPVRTNIKTNLNHRVNSQQSQQKNSLSSSPSSNTNQHENATDAVTRLVYKTVMMGSVPSLNQPSNNPELSSNPNEKQHFRNLSISSAGSGDTHLAGGKKVNEISGQLGARLSDNSNTPESIQHQIGASRSNPSSCNANIPMLINGEKLIDENDELFTEIIFVLPDNRGVRGRLYITNFRLYFKSDNGRRLRFATNSQTKLGKSRKQIYELIQKYAFPLGNSLNYFAFSYKQTFPDQTGWSVYDCKQEYERIGVTVKTNDWRFSTINQDFKFCDTYPKMLVVPQSIKDEDLKQVAEFRSKHRIPVLSWLKFDNRKNHVALLRSSQPLCGLTQKRNEKDENYLYKIYKLNIIDSLDKLCIMDARPLVNAYANRTTGGGHESEDNYKKCEISFLNIHNIHVMRESLRKIFDMSLPNPNLNQHQQQVASGASSSNTMSSSNSASSGSNHHRSISHGGTQIMTESQLNAAPGSNDDKNYFINLENSKWLEHLRSVLNGSLKIVKYINTYNSSVLVHCSDGWDRTAQLTSLSMIMMDKYYRTLKGFEVLVEKEWLSFGHRFGIRMGHGTDKHSDQDRSPIFLQFIDCVWQLMQQNSKVFEFNEKFLLTIVNNMYTCQFGTFLYNNECEREKNDVRNKTVSLWSYINSYKHEFKNSSFIDYDGVVECSTCLSSLQLWTAYYFQYKELVDDSNLNDIASSSSLELQQESVNYRSANQYTMTPPMAPSKIFGQAFFHQMVNQMKATVRSYNNTPSNGASSGQEPELIRYKAMAIQQQHHATSE